MAITHEYEIAWKRVLHYFDLHLNKRLNKQPPCWLLNALRRRQVTVMAPRITGQSNVCSIVCSDYQQRNIKGPRYCPFVMRIHCDRWYPTQQGEQHEKCFYLMTSCWIEGYHDGTCIILRNIHIALQPLTKQCSREVGMLASRWFLCYRWVRFLRTITPSVKSNVTTALLGVEGGHPRWQKD